MVPHHLGAHARAARFLRVPEQADEAQVQIIAALTHPDTIAVSTTAAPRTTR